MVYLSIVAWPNIAKVCMCSLSSAEVIMIIKCQVLVSSLLAQPTRSSQRTSAEERGMCLS